jgi:UDP-xylose/UDP-N-acetylglucosamine transporter B4
MSMESKTSNPEFAIGLTILLIAQLLSAYMGAYTEDTYTRYPDASWTENLFYSHFLGLPFFMPLGKSLRRQWTKLASTAPLDLSHSAWRPTKPAASDSSLDSLLRQAHSTAETMPQGIFYLLINATTQLACISGVNLVAAKSSAVTVTIVLNIRKLVSFMLSTWLFGHELSPKMLLGSAMVFGSGALYGWETSWRLPRERKRAERANGRLAEKQK